MTSAVGAPQIGATEGDEGLGSVITAVPSTAWRRPASPKLTMSQEVLAMFVGCRAHLHDAFGDAEGELTEVPGRWSGIEG